MRGAFVVNKYYTDGGTEYVAARLSGEFSSRGHSLIVTPCPTLTLDEKCFTSLGAGFDFVIFWDKDVAVARTIERNGVRVFDSAAAIAVCDDKLRTFVALENSGVHIPRTVSAPLTYDVSSGLDLDFIEQVEKHLGGYPIVVKENVGSQGRQVYLAESRDELKAVHAELVHTPHIFQQYVADERGVDIRVFVVGGKAIASCKRRNTTSFKSNVFLGGEAEPYAAPTKLLREAERIAAILGLDYGSVDFLSEDGMVFVEANSNAYMQGIEKLGFDIAGAYAEHVIRTVGGSNAG